VRKLLCVSGLLCLLLLIGSGMCAGDDKGNATEEKALKARAEAFVQAFNNGDAKALADFWTPDGDYVDQAGHTLSGRKAIQEAFEKQFTAAKGAKLKITPASLRFVKPDLAIEDGTTELFYGPDAPPTGARYTAVHVKQDGQWHLASVRDAVLVPPSNHDNLRDLDFLAGDWVDEADKGESARASFSWAENDNFLVSTFAVTLKDVPIGGGTQWIGWDGAEKRIRSWSFDSNGGFTEGTWTKDGDKLVVKTSATLRDGKKASATNIITKVDPDHFTWQSTQRSVDGNKLPDTEVVKMKRAK
jgi:uncharacterized protein (TIGR02246 family)